MNFFVPLRQNMSNKADIKARKWRLPAEWEPQWGVQLTWPHADTDWAPILNDIIETYHQMAREIAKRERLIVVAPEDALSVPLTIPGRATMVSSPSLTMKVTTVCSTTASMAGARNSLQTMTMPSIAGCMRVASWKANILTVWTSCWKVAPSRAMARARFSPRQVV